MPFPFPPRIPGRAAAPALPLIAAVLAPAPLAAQPAAPTAEATLPTIAVTAAPAGSLTVPGVAQERRAVDQTVGSVGFVDSESYKGRFSNTLRDVLENTPGVFVETRYGQELRLSIRGSGIARSYHLRGIELLQDGIPENLADGSGDYYQIDPLAARAVEVYKGGNGLAYGSSTLGGAIDFVTPTAYTALAPDIVRLEGGTFGTVRLNGQISRVLGGGFDALGNLTLTHSDGYRQRSRQDASQLNANLGYRISSNAETRFYVGDYIVAQQLPGTLTLGDALNRPTLAAASAVQGNQSRETWTERVANRTTVRLAVGQLDVDTWFIHKSLFHPIFQVIDQDGVTYGVGGRYTGSFRVAGFRDEIIAGARYFGGNNTALQYVNVQGSRGAQTLNSRQNAFNYEAYAENRFFLLPTVALMTGVKLLRNERDYVDEGGGLASSRGYTSLQRSYDGLNPKVGVLWEPRRDVQVFADLTRSQDVPDFTDLVQTQVNGNTGFVPLQAQHAWTVEVGTRGRYDRFTWDATLFRALIRGQLLQFNTVPNLIPASTFNAGRTVNQGIELAVGADLARDLTGRGAGDRLTVFQAWTYNDAKFRGDRQYGDNKIAGLPPHVLRTVLTYARHDGFYVSPAVDWVPVGAYADYANTLQVPAYATFGVQAGMDFPNGLSLFLDARNLNGKRYVSDLGTVTDARTASTAVFYPGNGRSVYVGGRAAF